MHSVTDFEMPLVGDIVMWGSGRGPGEAKSPAIVLEVGTSSKTLSLAVIGPKGGISVVVGSRNAEDPRHTGPIDNAIESGLGAWRLRSVDVQRQRELETLRAEIADLRATLADKGNEQ